MRAPTSGRVSRGFSLFHTAVDIVNAYRTPIRAPESGTISYVGQMGSGVLNAGNVVQIGDPAGDAHRLCHLDSYVVRVGQKVTEGQVVGYMGYTGFTIPAGIRGTHLHHIVFGDGRRVNPLNYYSVPSGEASIPPKMPRVGQIVHLDKGQTRSTFKAGTTTIAGTIRVTSDAFDYTVRGYDSRYPNRIIINSASGGGIGVALALYYTSGTKIEGWRIK